MGVEKDKQALAFQQSLLQILQDSFVPNGDKDEPWTEYVRETAHWIKENSPGLWDMICAQTGCATESIIKRLNENPPEPRSIYNEIVNTCVVAIASIRFKLEKEHGTFLGSHLEEEDL